MTDTDQLDTAFREQASRPASLDLSDGSDPRVVLVKPGDLLIISNASRLGPEAIKHAASYLTPIKDTLGLAGLLMFEADYDMPR